MPPWEALRTYRAAGEKSGGDGGQRDEGLRLLVTLFLLGQASCAAQSVAQDPLDLAVCAAHLVRGPALHRGPDLRVYAERILLAHGHVVSTLLVEGAGVEDGLSLGLAAEDDHQVGCHHGLAVVIELNHAAVGELLERHVHH